MEIKIGAIEGEEVDRRTRIDILTDEEEKIRAEREELELQKQQKDVNVIFDLYCVTLFAVLLFLVGLFSILKTVLESPLGRYCY